MKFSRLKFYDTDNAVDAVFFFPNGYGARVTALDGDEYELQLLVALKAHPKGLAGDSKPVLRPSRGDREEIERILGRIAKFPPITLKDAAWLE